MRVLIMREQRREEKNKRTLWNNKREHICSLSFHPIHLFNPSIYPYTANQQPQSLNYFICQLARLRYVSMNNSLLFFIWNNNEGVRQQIRTADNKNSFTLERARLFTCQVNFSGIFFLLSPFLSFVVCFLFALVIWTFKNKINFVVVNFSLLCSSSKMLLFSLARSLDRCFSLSFLKQKRNKKWKKKKKKK